MVHPCPPSQDVKKGRDREGGERGMTVSANVDIVDSVRIGRVRDMTL